MDDIDKYNKWDEGGIFSQLKYHQENAEFYISYQGSLGNNYNIKPSSLQQGYIIIKTKQYIPLY